MTEVAGASHEAPRSFLPDNRRHAQAILDDRDLE